MDRFTSVDTLDVSSFLRTVVQPDGSRPILGNLRRDFRGGPHRDDP